MHSTIRERAGSRAPRSALLLRLAGHLLELLLAHAGLGLLALPFALELGAHELPLSLSPCRHGGSPFGLPRSREGARRSKRRPPPLGCTRVAAPFERQKGSIHPMNRRRGRRVRA